MFDHNGVQFKIYNKKKCLHFKNIIQHTSLVKEEIIKETRKYFKLNDIGNTTNL